MKKYTNVTLITTALITAALIATQTTHSMLSRRTALSTSLYAPIATRAALTTPRITMARAMASKANNNTTINPFLEPVTFTTKVRSPRKPKKVETQTIEYKSTEAQIKKCTATEARKLENPTVKSKMPENTRSAVALHTQHNNPQHHMPCRPFSNLLTYIDQKIRAYTHNKAGNHNKAPSFYYLFKNYIQQEIKKYDQHTIDINAIVAQLPINENNDEIKKLLIAQRNINAISLSSGQTILFYAMDKGLIETANKLIDLGTYVNIRDKGGNTPLICAASYNHFEVVTRLIAAGARRNAKNQYGDTALMWAANHGDNNIALALLTGNTNANINTKNNGGSTALSCAVDNGYTDVARTLIANGADTINLSEEQIKKLKKMLPEATVK